MKQTLELTGTVELSREELMSAVVRMLQAEYNMKVVKADFDIQNNKINSVRFNVTKPTDTIVEEPEIKRLVRQVKEKKFTRKNVGVYAAIREFFNSERKKGVKFIEFSELFKLVKIEFPNMDEERLHLYLYDTTQFPGTHYSKPSGKIRL